jgi:hypothetical protein
MQGLVHDYYDYDRGCSPQSAGGGTPLQGPALDFCGSYRGAVVVVLLLLLLLVNGCCHCHVLVASDRRCELRPARRGV